MLPTISFSPSASLTLPMSVAIYSYVSRVLLIFSRLASTETIASRLSLLPVLSRPNESR